MSSVITREQLLQQPQNHYMSPDQLAFFRNYLHDLVRETLDRIDTLKLSLTESVTAPDVSDQASLEQIRSNNMRFLQVQQTNLQALRAAIKRIDDEDYGFCELTGEEIGLQRLLISPAATMSADAQSVIERQNKHRVA